MSSRSDTGFDRWLVDQLRKLYDEVLDEDVPEDLVKVVRGFDGPQPSEAGANPKQPRAEQAVSPRKSRRARG